MKGFSLKLFPILLILTISISFLMCIYPLLIDTSTHHSHNTQTSTPIAEHLDHAKQLSTGIIDNINLIFIGFILLVIFFYKKEILKSIFVKYFTKDNSPPPKKEFVYSKISLRSPPCFI